jgi:hypothetical protein
MNGLAGGAAAGKEDMGAREAKGTVIVFDVYVNVNQLTSRQPYQLPPAGP